MELECKICNKKFETGESLEQHKKAKHSSLAKTRKPIKIKKYVLLSFFIVALLIFGITFYLRSQKSSPYDKFALCLREKNVVIYGNDFCQYTTKQLNMFGNSEKFLNYVKCIDNKELCDSKNVKITPTWKINGNVLEGVQSFERLSELTGCKIS